MRSGDVVLIRLPQTGGGPLKLRPALILSTLPGPYQNLLMCGISTPVQHVHRDWDELIQPSDPDFVQTGLRRASIARLERR